MYGTRYQHPGSAGQRPEPALAVLDGAAVKRTRQWAASLDAVFSLISNPSFLVGADARLYAATKSATALLIRAESFSLRDGYVTFERRDIRLAFYEQLGVLTAEPDVDCGRFGLVVPRPGRGHPFHLDLRRFRVSIHRSGGVPPLVKVDIIDLESRPPLSRERVHALFGFTERESDLAERLVRGEALEEAAQALGISRETARSHLKQLFEKSDTRRQAQLVRLLVLVCG